jgi:SAM-dependent methyltransferase
LVHRKFRAATLRRLRRVSARERFSRAIDLGCGVGEWTAEYASFADTVVGVDVNRSFLSVAAQHARTKAVEQRVAFHEQSIEEFDQFENADLVCCGSCLMYIDDDAVAKLFARIARRTSQQAWVYVRATVTNPLRTGYTTDGGFYREPSFYERVFAENGFSVADRMYSGPILAYESCARLTRMNHEKLPARLLEALIVGGHWLRRVAGGRNNYLNWISHRA